MKSNTLGEQNQEETKSTGKPWQNGIPLDTLKQIESKFDMDYNKYSLSPFTRMKKNDVAKYIHNQELMGWSRGMYVLQEVKVRSPICMFPNDVKIGEKLPGDCVISYITGDFKWVPRGYINSPVWLYCWAENTKCREQVEKQGFRYIGGKITTFGEIFSIYFKDSETQLFPRDHPAVYNKAQFINIMKVGDVGHPQWISKIKKRLCELDLQFTNHYSNYNNGKSWSAISLRGYSADPGFITDPVEMNAKWHEKHKGEIFALQDTPLRQQFPEVNKLIASIFPGSEIHRIRFMKLNGHDGDLGRHTDISDPKGGKDIGKLLRFHFPIITNPDVIFTSWHSTGFKSEKNMKVGEYWFLDTRYPHMVHNGGDTDRIHLVIDVVIDYNILGRINPNG